MKAMISLLCFPVGVGALLAFAGTAAAQEVIKSPTAHTQYFAELEPHLAFNFIGDGGVGIGGRATFELLDPGFIPSINNSVGIGVGLDWLNGRDHCNPGGCYGYDRLVLPVVMQWNFWFTPHWSAFGEPGLAFRFNDNNAYYNNNDLNLDFALYVGGRYNFNDQVALTLRLGTPNSSIGVSFFL